MHVQKAPSPTVCLFTSNPLTIAECQGLLYLADYTLRVQRTEIAADGKETPYGDVYVIEAGPRAEDTQELVVRILSREPSARILVIGDAFDEDNAFPLLTMGVKGMIRRSELRADLTRALSAVYHSGFWVPRTLLSKFISNILTSTRRMLFALGSADLNDRQTSLLNSMLETDSDTELANKLNVSEPELKTQVSELMRKFNVRRRWDLVLLAHQAAARA